MGKTGLIPGETNQCDVGQDGTCWNLRQRQPLHKNIVGQLAQLMSNDRGFCQGKKTSVDEKNSFTARVVIHSSSTECYYEGVWHILRKCHEQEAEHVVKAAVSKVGHHQK